MSAKESALFKENTEKKLIKRLLQPCVSEELLPHSISENTLIAILQQTCHKTGIDRCSSQLPNSTIFAILTTYKCH